MLIPEKEMFMVAVAFCARAPVQEMVVVVPETVGAAQDSPVALTFAIPVQTLFCGFTRFTRLIVPAARFVSDTANP